MELHRIFSNIIFLALVNSLVIKNNEDGKRNVDKKEVENPDTVFNGVYSECFLHLSYSCLQKKTLLYLKELNNLSEVSVIGDYVKFVKINTTYLSDEDDTNTGNTDELAFMIDKAVDDFFVNHVLKFNAMGRDIAIPRNMEEFVGRKKRKGGGGGGMMGGHGGGGGHDDGGKKKMMMMAMMCMKMKLMMMIPAMMGMMGMMSFKGMMFSMMSFMLSKMMLLMKILEKKGGAGGIGGGGGGGDGGWAAGGGGGGAWMPAGGQDFGGGGGGGGGGYDANGQWQSRSIAESLDINKPTVYYRTIENVEKSNKIPYDSYNVYPRSISNENVNEADTAYNFNSGTHDDVLVNLKTRNHFNTNNSPEISYVKPVVRYNNKIEVEVAKKPVLVYKKSNVDFGSYEQEPINYIDGIKNDSDDDSSSSPERTKRSLSNLLYLNTESTTEKMDYANIETTSNAEKLKTIEITRKKRSILDLLQMSYMYWMSKILGLNNNRRTNLQKYKVINGVKYVYYPFKPQRPKMPKEVQLTSTIKLAEDRPVITAEDFNKGEIMEGAVESRMNKKKLNKIKDTVNDTMEDNPWE